MYTAYLQAHGLDNLCLCFVLPHFSIFSFLPPLAQKNIFLSLKSSKSCVLLLPTPLTSVICPSIKSRRRQFHCRILSWIIMLESPLKNSNRTRRCQKGVEIEPDNTLKSCEYMIISICRSLKLICILF